MDTRFKNTDFFIEDIDESVKDLTVNDSSVSHLPANTDFFIENIDNNVIEICTDRGITPTAVSVVPANTDFFIVNIDSNVKKIASDLSITPSSVQKVPANTDFFIENIYFNLVLICEELNIEPYEISATPTNTDLFIEAIAKNVEKIMEAQTEIHVSGTFIHAVLSADSKISEYELEGNATQNGTPTPDAPQSINVVTGEQTNKVVGKNLFEITDSTRTSTGVDWAKSNNIITATGTSERGTYAECETIFGQLATGGNYSSYIPITSTNSFRLPAGTYTLSAHLENRGTTPSIGLAVGIGSTIGVRPTTTYKLDNLGQQTRDAQQTFTVTDSDWVLLSVYYEGNASNKDVDLTISNIQLELGSTATTYEPYQGQSYEINLGSIELAKIGDYQDRIYKDDGKWYIEKQVGKVVYDGSENWSAGEGGGNRRFTSPQNAEMMGGSGRNAILSDYFNTNSGNAGGTGFIYQQRIYLYWGTMDNTASDFKTWLSTHNTTVYYALATPTTTEITDETLLSQLNDIYDIELKEGEVNISITATSPNLPASLKATIIAKE